MTRGEQIKAVEGIIKKECGFFNMGKSSVKKLSTIIVDAIGLDNVDIEPICADVHKAYCQSRLDQGREEYWTRGDYSRLDEETKEIDRYTVRSVLKSLSQSKDIIKIGERNG